MTAAPAIWPGTAPKAARAHRHFLQYDGCQINLQQNGVRAMAHVAFDLPDDGIIPVICGSIFFPYPDCAVRNRQSPRSTNSGTRTGTHLLPSGLPRAIRRASDGGGILPTIGSR